MGVGGQRYVLAALHQEGPGSHCVRGWVGHRAGMEGCGKSPPPRSTGTRSPDRPACSESLYRLSYAGPQITNCTYLFCNASVG
jgi:hypothetical protein